MKKLKQDIYKARGITLIALVITIVVLLILAGVSISMLAGENGIIKKGQESKIETRVGEVKEEADIIRGEYITENMGEQPTAEYIIKELINRGKISDSEIVDYGIATGIGILNVEDRNIEITGNIDFESILKDAVENPEKYKHSDQSDTNGDIGIDSNGNSVNMDLWTYYLGENTILNIPYGIQLASKSGYGNGAGYKDSNIVDGKIIGEVPKYVIPAEEEQAYPVVYVSFVNCTNLVIAPQIPNTVTSMANTFMNCSNLTTVQEIPENVNSLKSTFYLCKSLTTAPKIHKNIKNLYFTFNGCNSLTGTIEINANPSDYAYCFENASISTDENVKLYVTGTSDLLDEIIATKSEDSKIEKLVTE